MAKLPNNGLLRLLLQRLRRGRRQRNHPILIVKLLLLLRRWWRTRLPPLLLVVPVGRRTHQHVCRGRATLVTVAAAARAATLRFAFLFHLQLLAQDGGDLALHERPRYRRVGQRTLFAARAVHLGTGALSLDALAAAGETELVVSHRGALHKVRIFEPFLAQGTLERGVGRGGRRSAGSTAGYGSVDTGGTSWPSGWTSGTAGSTTSGWSDRADRTRGQTSDDVLTGSGLRTGLRLG